MSSPFHPPVVSLNAPVAVIADVLNQAGSIGVVTISDISAPDVKVLQGVFDKLQKLPDLGKRANKAYPNNLVYKDSFAAGNGGAAVDMKRVLDLSPERIEAIFASDPTLHAELGPEFQETVSFWRNAQAAVAPKLLDALEIASGGADVKSDAHFNFRMVDYYERPTGSVAPRCGEHRDFGSFTLIYAERPGLEICIDDKWMPVAPPGANAATLVFGWCTQIRSNDRLAAALHRVTDECQLTAAGTVPRRTSAVFFCAPKQCETLLEPVVLPGETAHYKTVKAGQLRGGMGRKWRHREGTLSVQDRLLEESEIRIQRLVTQDDVVRQTVQLEA